MVSTTKSLRRKFDSNEQEAYLAIWRTYDRLKAIEEEFFTQWNITAQQYNLLRLLRNTHPKPIPTLSVFNRLVSRAPDVTRMLDRLEKLGLINRSRTDEDRRTVLIKLTPQAMDLLNQIDEPLRQCHERQLGHLSPTNLKALTALLQKARAPHEPEGSIWKD